MSRLASRIRAALIVSLALMPGLASAQRPADPNEVSHAVTLLGRDNLTGLPCYMGTSTSCVLPANGSAFGGMTATLASAVGAAGAQPAVYHVFKDSYFFTCTAGTWNSASAQLQFLGPDGATWLNFSGAALTANGVIGVGIGANSSVRVLVTGTPTNLNCNLT